MHPLILFVCTGNICRSPMAEAVGRHLDREGRFRFASAGTVAVDGSPATPEVSAALAEHKIALHDHHARPVEVALGDEPRWILGLTGDHVRWIHARYPDLADRTSRLDPDGADIDDPYGRELAAYRTARDEIEAAITARLRVGFGPIE